jgi:hypothetical protein
LSISTVTFLALGRKSIFRPGLSYKVLSINQQNLATTIALLKVFFKAHILNNQCMEVRSFINMGNNLLSKNRANIVRGVGLAVFLINLIRNVLILHLVNL